MAKYRPPSFKITNLPAVYVPVGEGVGEIGAPTTEADAIEQALNEWWAQGFVDDTANLFASVEAYRPGTTSETAFEEWKDTMRAIAMGQSTIPNIIEAGDLGEWQATYGIDRYKKKGGQTIAQQMMDNGEIMYVGDGKYALTTQGIAVAAEWDIRAKSGFREEEAKTIATERAEVESLGGQPKYEGVDRTRDPATGELTDPGKGSPTEAAAAAKAKQEAEAGKKQVADVADVASPMPDIGGGSVNKQTYYNTSGSQLSGVMPDKLGVGTVIPPGAGFELDPSEMDEAYVKAGWISTDDPGTADQTRGDKYFKDAWEKWDADRAAEAGDIVAKIETAIADYDANYGTLSYRPPAPGSAEYDAVLEHSKSDPRAKSAWDAFNVRGGEDPIAGGPRLPEAGSNTGESEEGLAASRGIKNYRDSIAKIQEELAQELAELGPSREGEDAATTERRQKIFAEMAGLEDEDKAMETIQGKVKDGKFGLEDLKNVMTAVAAGAGIWDVLKGTDDVEVDVAATLQENLAALTDEGLREDMKQAQWEDQPEFGAMEQFAKEQSMFGDATVDVFGDPDQGARMQSEYDQARLTDTDLTKEEFIRNWIRENPSDPYAQELNQRFSALGQIGRATEEFGEIGREETLRNVAEASRFYQSKETGGLGYTAEQFRAPDMQRSIDYAMGRAFGPEATDLRKRRYEEFQKGGVLGEETLSALQQSAFKGVDPSLVAQTKFGGGGLAKSVLGTEWATRDRRREGETDLLQVLQAERAYAPTLAGVVQAGTPDPLTVMGVNAVSPGVGANVYGQAGEIGTAMYDPTSAYAASSQQQSLMADMFNEYYQPGAGEQLGDLAEGIGKMQDSIDKMLS